MMRKFREIYVYTDCWDQERLGTRDYLLSEFWLSFLHGGHDEISRSGGWESVQSTFDALKR